jgi:hypothetical protein
MGFKIDEDFVLVANVEKFDLVVSNIKCYTIEEIKERDVKAVLGLIKSLIKPLINKIFNQGFPLPVPKIATLDLSDT